MPRQKQPEIRLAVIALLATFKLTILAEYAIEDLNSCHIARRNCGTAVAETAETGLDLVLNTANPTMS